MENKPNNPAANPVIVLREEFDNWAMLYNPDTGGTLNINPVGVAVWKLLDGKHSMAEIIDGVKAHFEEVPETVENDVVAFIQELEKKGFAANAPEVPSQTTN